MAALNLVVRTTFSRSYGLLRRGFFGSASVLKRKKDPITGETPGEEKTDIGDIVRDDSVKATESDSPENQMKMEDVSKDDKDFGEIVRDETVKAVHIDSETKTEKDYMHAAKFQTNNGPSPFSIDDMLLESATDSSNGDEYEGDEDYYYYDSEDDMKRQILNSALEFVPEHGWTDLAIQKGAEVEGLSSAVAGLFPKGPGDLVLHFIEECNTKLAEQLLEESRLNSEAPGAADIPKRSTTEFIQDALVLRLSMLRPYIHTWPEAMRLLMRPENATAAMESLAHMVDEVWYHAGDTSTDFNWYTKRGALATIYGLSEVFMTNDCTAEFEGTKQFVKDRLENANQLKKATLMFEDAANNLCSGLSHVISTAQNIIGYNCRKR